MRPFLPRAAVAAVATLAALPAIAGINLITNGDFETGDFTGWGTEAASMGSEFGVVMQPHTGVYSARFSGATTEYDSFFQSVTTIPGEQYLLEYWIQNFGAGNDSLQIMISGGSTFTETPVSAPLEDWQMRSFEFTAFDVTTEFRFNGYDTISSFLIDDISVTLVPAPGAAALLGLGVFCMLLTRRR